MSTKSKKSTKTKKSLDPTISQRDDLKCWVQEQDPYRLRSVGGTIRDKKGSIWGYSKHDKPPGKTKIDRYPYTAEKKSEQGTDGM